MSGSYVFGDIDFHPRADNAQPVLQPGEGLFSIRHIPFSTADILDLGGVSSAQHYGPIEVRIDAADVAAFEALYAAQASAAIKINNVDYSRGTLVQLTNKTITPHGDTVWYQAHWVIG